MGVEGGGAGRLPFLRREQLIQPLTLRRPIVIIRIEDLGQSTPTDIPDEHALFRRSGTAVIVLNAFEQFQGGQVVPALGLERARAKAIRSGDAVVVLIAGRFGFDHRRECGGFEGAVRAWLALVWAILRSVVPLHPLWPGELRGRSTAGAPAVKSGPRVKTGQAALAFLTQEWRWLRNGG